MDKVANNEKISEAVKLINNRSYKEALECLKDIVNENKNDPKIFNLYGIVQLQLNKMNVLIVGFGKVGKIRHEVIKKKKFVKKIYVFDPFVKSADYNSIHEIPIDKYEIVKVYYLYLIFLTQLFYHQFRFGLNK